MQEDKLQVLELVQHLTKVLSMEASRTMQFFKTKKFVTQTMVTH